MYYRKDITNQRFGRLVAIRDSGKRKHRSIVWLCRCDCGNLAWVSSEYLRSERTRSCGCIRKENARKKGIKASGYKHGGVKTRLYLIWIDMRRRCSNKNRDCYCYYGERGIKVCSEWKEYASFKQWALINGYADNLTIDRVNSGGNYEPSNCQWLTMSENSKKQHRERKEKKNEGNIPKR